MSPTPDPQYDALAADYDQWYIDNSAIFQAEIAALKAVSPNFANALEVGVGTGIFATQLGVKQGIDPSPEMLDIARKRGIDATLGVAEQLPYADGSFDGIYLITVDCYLQLPTALAEVKRVLTDDGVVVMGILDWSTPAGQARRESHQDSPYYQGINFNSAESVQTDLREAGFTIIDTRQTIFTMEGDHSNPTTRYPIREGTGEGYFAAIAARVNPHN